MYLIYLILQTYLYIDNLLFVCLFHQNVLFVSFLCLFLIVGYIRLVLLIVSEIFFTFFFYCCYCWWKLESVLIKFVIFFICYYVSNCHIRIYLFVSGLTYNLLLFFHPHILIYWTTMIIQINYWEMGTIS